MSGFNLRVHYIHLFDRLFGERRNLVILKTVLDYERRTGKFSLIPWHFAEESNLCCQLVRWLKNNYSPTTAKKIWPS